MDRRKMLSSGSAAAVAALAGCATSGAQTSAGGSRTVFAVAQPMLPIAGTSEMFPVRRIYCIGRNYAAHAREMGSDPNREPPADVWAPLVAHPASAATAAALPLDNTFLRSMISVSSSR